ncbi:MAG: hypothetical protein ACT4PT_02485, partial [Methanobacteriota archaeon]
WIRANQHDFQLVKEAGLDETGILTSASDYHIFLKFKKKRREVMDGYLDVVEAALTSDIIPRCHFEDVTRGDLPGFVLPFTQALMEKSREYGLPVKIRLCDTMGFGVPYPEATLPRSVPKMVANIRKEGGVPSEWLEWHGHNDFHHVHSNSVAAWLYGCASVNGTLLSTGERTGNTPIEAAVVEWCELQGSSKDVRLQCITEIADYYRKNRLLSIPANYPFVGTDFATTRAGIHIDASAKDFRIYNIFDTEKLLGRRPGIGVTDKSGASGIAFWVNEAYRLDGKDRVEKTDPRVDAVYRYTLDEYNKGRTTAISDDEMHALVAKHFPELAKRRS